MKKKAVSCLRIALIILLSLFFLFCAYKVFSYLITTLRAKQYKTETEKYRPQISYASDTAEASDTIEGIDSVESQETVDDCVKTPAETEINNGGYSEEYSPKEMPDIAFPGLAELYLVNDDLVGWITIPDTNIDYPVYQADDNYYYLYKSYRRTRLLSGTIFLDCRSLPDLSYGNAIIYGHQMDNGTMFEDVRKFADKSYFESHRTGYYTSLTEQFEIEFFAYLRVPKTSKAYTIVFQDEWDHQNYLSYIRENALYFEEIDFSSDNRYFLLSTCTYEIKEGRGILIGKAHKIS